MTPYHDETLKIIEQLTNENLNIAEKDGAVILSVSDEDFRKILPMGYSLVEEVILHPQLSAETLKELAERYGVDSSLISAVTRKEPKRPVPRYLALRAFLMSNPLPTVEEADRLLMKLSLPGLYISTFRKDVNRQNWLLRQILELGQDTPCPLENWLIYADTVMDAFGFPPVSAHKPEIFCPQELKEQIEQWRTEINGVSFQNFRILRHNLLQRYMDARGLNYTTDKAYAYEELSRQAAISEDRIRSLFGLMTNRNSVGGRVTLILLAIAMGCTLTETNAILLQANRALLYPNCSRLDEIEWVRQLCHNDPEPI